MYSYVYILASKPYGTLYVGVTSGLVKRTFEHKEDLVQSFTSKYQVHDLVYYELHEAIEEAIKREKRLKKWKREWKIKLIESLNPTWKDLFDDVIQ